MKKILFPSMLFAACFSAVFSPALSAAECIYDETKIQAAIDEQAGKENGYVCIGRGEYSKSFEIKGGVTVEGEEAAETFILIQISVAEGEGGTLQKLTFRDEGNISAAGADGLIIRNNIFLSTDNDSAISIFDPDPEIPSTANIVIQNNTFFRCSRAIDVAANNETVEIGANIFAENTVTIIENGNELQAEKDGNYYYANDDIDDDDEEDKNPLFVDESLVDGADLHLKENSPCIKLEDGDDPEYVDPDGSLVDYGAYGGPNMDRIPKKIGTSPTTKDGIDNSVEITWTENPDYRLTGYKIYFDTEKISSDASYGDGNVVTLFKEEAGSPPAWQISGLKASSSKPLSPTGLTASTGEERIYVSWNKVDGAEGYDVLLGTSEDDLSVYQDVGDVARFEISGLESETTYYVAVRGYTDTDYYFAVSTLVDDVESRLSPNSNPHRVDGVDGDPSNTVSAVTQKISGFPDLPSRGGCFVSSVGAEGSDGPDVHDQCVSGSKVKSKCLIAGTLIVVAMLLLGGKFSLFFILPLFFLALPARASNDRPLWSVNVQGGIFHPAQEDWNKYYRSDSTEDWRAGFGLWLSRNVLLGLEGGMRSAKGDVSVNDKGETLAVSLTQELTVFPVQTYLLFDGTFKEGQLLSPFAGIGYSRYYYRLKVEDGTTTKGHLHGWHYRHYRFGLKLLLNSFDPRSALRAKQGYGVDRTFLTLEAQHAKVNDFGNSEDADLGGWSYFGGVSVDF